MNTFEFFDLINKPLVYDNKFVIGCMNAWQEYNFAGRLLYSYNPELNQDNLGIFSQEDFDSYIQEQADKYKNDLIQK